MTFYKCLLRRIFHFSLIFMIIFGFPTIIDLSYEYDMFHIEDYFPSSPGRYILFKCFDNGSIPLNDCIIEMVFQYTKKDKVFITLTQIGEKGGYWRNSVIIGRIQDGILQITGGCPVGNQANLFRLFSLPQTFKEGDTWNTLLIPQYKVTFIGNRTVDSLKFTNCIKIEFQSSDGEGVFYLSKNVGIIEYIFKRWDNTVFSAKIIEYGKLDPITISGILTLDGVCPARGYGVGISNCGDLGINTVKTNEKGYFTLKVFGHELILMYGPVREDGRFYIEAKKEIKLTDLNEDFYLELCMDITHLHYLIEIDEIEISDDRCDVGSYQEIGFHAVLKCDHPYSGYLNASFIEIFINDTKYKTDKTGWIKILVYSDEVGEKKWIITDVPNYEFKMGVRYPSIIWDKVKLIIPEIQRIDVNQRVPKWFGYYLYNNETFNGLIILNDTFPKDVVSKVGYCVIDIIDPKYGLTCFDANDFTVIFDRVHLNLSLADNRIDVGEEPELVVSGFYEYDGTPFRGQVKLSTPPDYSRVGEYTYTVEEIYDPLYNLTCFTCNNVTCIWDRIVIVDGGVSREVTSVGKTETVWFKALYEYDKEPFTGEDGVLYLNGEPMTWSPDEGIWKYTVVREKPGSITFKITGVDDQKYGLTVFKDLVGPLTIEWQRPFWQEPMGIILVGGMIAVVIFLIFSSLKKRSSL